MAEIAHTDAGRAGARLTSLDIGSLSDGEAAALGAALEAAGIDAYEIVPGAGALGGTLFSYPMSRVEDALGAVAQVREASGAAARSEAQDRARAAAEAVVASDPHGNRLYESREPYMDDFLEQGGYDGPWLSPHDPAKGADAGMEAEGKEPQMDGKKFDGVSVNVPKTVGRDRPSVRPFAYRDKETGDVRRMCEVTLPAHTRIGGADASFHRFTVKESQVKEFDNDPGYFHVVMPRANRDGEPWSVKLTRDFGGWEHPDAQGGERGKWVKDERTLDVGAAELDGAMREYRERRKENAQRAAKAGGDKSPAAAKGNARNAAAARTADAPAPAQTMAR